METEMMKMVVMMIVLNTNDIVLVLRRVGRGKAFLGLARRLQPLWPDGSVGIRVMGKK